MAPTRSLLAALVAMLGSARALLRVGRLSCQPNTFATRASVFLNSEQATASVLTPRKVRQSRLNVRIDDKWYDLTEWRVAHPAGTHWIDAYNNSDATEVMYGFHSQTALNMFKRLPQSRAPPTGVGPPTQATYAFRALRQRLVDEGWYKPQLWGETKKLLPWAAALATGVALARTAAGRGPLRAFLGVLFLGSANTLAGWLSHDFVHGRSSWASNMRGFGELVGGMSTTWWSNKHNMHHALTNEVGYDEDIALDPFLYLWEPDPKNDVPWLRRWQHVFWPVPYSILFLYWRIDSIRFVLKHKKWNEAARLAIHWAAFSALVPAHLLFFSIWLSGLLTATIVTVTHQSEEIFFGENLRKYDFVEAQFRSTRNAKCNNPISNMLWGGMQWQLEHHLFPTMPRYRYPAVSKELQRFAEENSLDYRITGEFKIIADNVALLKKLATAEQVAGNPRSDPIFKQV
mmetsp:Transcript_16921/g.28174  ORF Transcript_16921/g.28174 Transcript_16921/m.28174 type:complete len:459 (+) Transcript_16921:38-1414(+)